VRTRRAVRDDLLPGDPGHPGPPGLAVPARVHHPAQPDRAGQAGYFAECVLGGMHGLAVDDLMTDLDLETDWGGELMRRFMLAAPGELERFIAAKAQAEFESSPAAAALQAKEAEWELSQ